MRRGVLVLVAALLLVPPAAAQFAREVTAVGAAPGGEYVIGPGGGVFIDMRVEMSKDMHFFDSPFFVAGLDNVVNLTVNNHQDTWWNATFEHNVTGATATPTTSTFAVPPFGAASATFVVHPDDIGRVRVDAHSPDGFLPHGELARATLDFYAVPGASVRFLDPPPLVTDPEYDSVSGYRGPIASGGGFVRVRPGEPITPRVEVRNPLSTGIPPFELVLRSHQGDVGRVSVPSLEAGQSREIEFPEYTAEQARPGGGYYGGGGSSYQLWLSAVHRIAGLDVTSGAGSFEVRNGAVHGLAPASAVVEVQSGVVIDVLVPKEPTLGVPKRIKFNVTNYGLTPTAGTAVLRLETPGGHHYGVQGPETRTVPVQLNPGQTVSGAIDFTPRVTGHWSISTSFRSDTGGSYGYGGPGFLVKGPLSIGVDQIGVVFTRIGQPVRAEVAVTSAENLPRAELLIASNSGRRYGFDADDTGEIRPGVAADLVRLTSGPQSLGDLRPGGTTNVTIEVVARGAGRYTVVPYVLADGFAYTSESSGARIMRASSSMPMPMPPGGYQGSSFDIAVLPRVLPTALALAPLSVGLALFVGTWTLRTRFVK